MTDISRPPPTADAVLCELVVGRPERSDGKGTGALPAVEMGAHREPAAPTALLHAHEPVRPVKVA
jgi:hypothetical protein